VLQHHPHDAPGHHAHPDQPLLLLLLLLPAVLLLLRLPLLPQLLLLLGTSCVVWAAPAGLQLLLEGCAAASEGLWACPPVWQEEVHRKNVSCHDVVNSAVLKQSRAGALKCLMCCIAKVLCLRAIAETPPTRTYNKGPAVCAMLHTHVSTWFMA
jgi:hypothetical protein